MIDLEGLLETGRTGHVRVGIGLEPRRLSRTSEDLEKRGCGVDLVGYSDARTLVRALMDEDVDAAVRGTLGSGGAVEAMRTLSATGTVMRTAVMSDANGRPFLLTPVGIDEGNSLEQRLELVRRTVRYFTPAGWRIEVGVLSKGRPEDKDRGNDIARSLEEGEAMKRALTAEGVPARHYSILVEEAVRERDLVVAPDGVVGNLMFRTLHFLGDGKSYGAPIVNLPRVFVDTSRAKEDYSGPVLLAAGLAHAGCGA
ncbi:MAG: hypothetical protein JSV90_03520 [Methanobacteriota archaeon]|nr:MAG: hypothetical protein JSV90_03520 [Euryarchaeota archaeon]